MDGRKYLERGRRERGEMKERKGKRGKGSHYMVLNKKELLQRGKCVCVCVCVCRHKYMYRVLHLQGERPEG